MPGEGGFVGLIKWGVVCYFGDIFGIQIDVLGCMLHISSKVVHSGIQGI